MSIASTPLDRVLDPVFAGEAARQMIDFKIDPAMEDRLQHLRVLATEGRLLADEREEYERFVDRLDLIATFQAEARVVLSRRSTR